MSVQLQDFNGLEEQYFATLSNKQKIVELLSVAQQIAEHDCTIEGKYFDDVELGNAQLEDEFEAVFSALRTAYAVVKASNLA